MTADEAARLLRRLTGAQRDSLLAAALERGADPLLVAEAEAAVGGAAGEAAAAGALLPPALFADLPAPALELVATHLYASLAAGSAPPPIAGVLAAARALRGTCRGWRRAVLTATTVHALHLGPSGDSRLWWDPTHGAATRIVVLQALPRIYPRAGPAAGMALPPPDATAGGGSEAMRMQVQCAVVRTPGSGAVRLEVTGSGVADGGEHPHGQVEVAQPGGAAWVRGTVREVSRGELPWQDTVPFPWPDLFNINPRPIYRLPLPEDLGTVFGALSRLSLGGLRLGALPKAISTLASLKRLELCGNLLRELPVSVTA